MIEALTSAGYALVEASWHATAVFIKFYLSVAAFRLYRRDELNKEKISEMIIGESRLVIPTLLVIGGLMVLFDLELRPRFELLSELIALVYMGYLFWEF